MIHKTLPVIIADLNNFLKRSVSLPEDLVLLSSLVDQSGSLAFEGSNKIICTLTAIEEERVKGAMPQATMLRQTPPIRLKLNLLLSAYFPGNYIEALKFISLVISFFQGKKIFTPQNTPGLPESVDKLTVEFNNLDQNAQHQLWSALGANMLPSINLKLRMIQISEIQLVDEIPEIKGLETTPN